MLIAENLYLMRIGHGQLDLAIQPMMAQLISLIKNRKSAVLNPIDQLPVQILNKTITG